MDDPETETPQISSSVAKHKGNWITFPFIIGTVAWLGLAGSGWISNLIVYLINEFNVKSIDAAEVNNIVNGAYNLFPILGAVLADSFLGSFFVVAISSFISLLGIVLLALTATLSSLRPKPCRAQESSLCQAPSSLQYAVLYGGFAVASLGLGGSRLTIATLGANQFDKEEDPDSFFNWFFVAIYISSVISATAIVYIQANVSWSLGFWVCVAANVIGILFLLLGSHFYRHDKPNGSPFTHLARVVVAAIRKRKALLSSKTEDYCFDNHGNELSASITKSFKFFNRAALKTGGEIKPDGSIAKPWKLCTVQQVEDLKRLIRVFPIGSSVIFLSTPITILMGLTVLQALTMDCQLGNRFKIPAASIQVIMAIATSIFLTVNDRILFPGCQKLTKKSPTLFQRIGISHLINVLSIDVSALVESKRLNLAHAHHYSNESGTTVPMHVLWLFPQLIIAGIGEAFYVPGQSTLYYQEFPESL